MNMKSLFVLFATLLLIGGAIQITRAADNDIRALRAATHIITVYSEDNERMGNGSGVMIAPTVMLTAAHVAETGHMTVGVQEAPVLWIVAMNKDKDIALLRVAMGCPCVPLAEAPPAVDTEVAVIGFPINYTLHAQVVTWGQVQDIHDNRMLLNVLVAGGNSGGGVFAKENGEWRVVGILVEMAAECRDFSCLPVNHLSRAVDLDTIRDFMGSA